MNKSVRFLRVNRLAVLCLFLPWLVVQSASQTPAPAHLRYRLIDLGTFGGPNSSETVEFPYINNRGMVVGFADTDTPDPFNPGGFIPHAFRWKHGVLTDLGTLPGGYGSFAIWSNDRGQVVGLSDNGEIDPVLGGPQGRGVLWESDGSIVNLGTLGGTQSLAGAINNQGQIIGVAADEIPDPYSIFGWATETRGFVWEKGAMRDLGTLGGTDTSPSFINQNGQIAGVSYVNSNPSFNCDLPLTTHPFIEGDEVAHPFLWHGGKLNDLGTIGGTFGVATWLNDAVDVAGGATTVADEEFHAFFWRDGVMVDIGTVANDTCSVVHFMNSRGEVSGTSGDCAGEFERHGFIWQPGGSMIDLNDFVPPGSDLTITDGETINDCGEIAGSGMLPNGDFHAVVLIPCDTGHGDSEGCQDSGREPKAPQARRPRTFAGVESDGRQLSARELVSRFLSRPAHARTCATNKGRAAVLLASRAANVLGVFSCPQDEERGG